ncbi:hypothetical protein GE061_008249 [Apolygus lucorum]|uniref:Uncharacterized protein n=1 Tax=Apolygus lucorum TaxID=248454 RepID=A0A8S9WQS4_APOLU|nr:hypothetical protein GE061_008249 [Apolygus lucorum]
MLIQLARNGVDMANCIPTKNQYLIDCRSVCAPKAQPESTCRVYNNCDEVLKCEKVGELNCQPDRRCSVYNVQGLQHNRVKCSVMPDCTKIYDVECEQSCRQGNFQNGPYPWGNMYPKVAMPDCAGDMSRPKWWWPPAQERQSSYQENWNRYSSSRRSSDPREGSSRFFLGRPSNYKRSSTQTRDTTTRDKHLSDVSTKTMNPWAYCGPGVETNEMRKDDKKNQKGGKNKNERGGNGHGKRSSMDSTRFDKEPNRSRSPSLLKNLKSTVEQSKMLKSRPSSPPHFDDIEPSNRASGSTKSLYEADMMEAMERVKKRYTEHNYDTTGSSSRGKY